MVGWGRFRRGDIYCLPNCSGPVAGPELLRDPLLSAILCFDLTAPVPFREQATCSSSSMSEFAFLISLFHPPDFIVHLLFEVSISTSDDFILGLLRCASPTHQSILQVQTFVSLWGTRMLVLPYCAVQHWRRDGAVSPRSQLLPSTGLM